MQQGLQRGEIGQPKSGIRDAAASVLPELVRRFGEHKPQVDAAGIFHNYIYTKILDVELTRIFLGSCASYVGMQDKQILGIHHVTAIAGSPQGNIDFYAGVLGLRLVKLTVNFDDPNTYHLYYGDYSGRPGTILTFFPWRDIPRGIPGGGQMTGTSLSVPLNSLEYWKDRLASHGVRVEQHDDTLAFRDSDGMQLELAAVADARPGWPGGPVPDEAAIRGLHGATLAVDRADGTARLLTETMGFEESEGYAESHAGRRRFTISDGQVEAFVDLVPPKTRGRQGAGSVHHIAWRTATDEQQLAWRAELTGHRFGVSPVMDRTYFHSIYYREPNGILFEIATDSPGFTVDEPVENLGSKLILPPWIEPHRADLVRALPPLELPHSMEAQHA